MKRLVWIQLIMMLLSFCALIKGYGFLANLVLAISIYLLFVVRKHINMKRMLTMSFVLFAFMHLISINAGLYEWYQGTRMLVVLLSIHLALYNEYLASYKSIKVAGTAYLFYLLSDLLFGFMLFMVKDVIYLIYFIPKGFVSLAALVSIIFIPYLVMMTLSFIVHEYNY